jgi:hypothetical protein
VSGHGVFLGGHDSVQQDESLVVHVTIPFQIGAGTDSDSAAISLMNDLGVGGRLGIAVSRYEATVLLSWA